MKRLWRIIYRELGRIIQRPIYAFGIFFAPILTAVTMLLLMRSGLPTNLPAAIVDMDNSATSRTVIRQLNCFSKTDVVMQTMDYTEAREALQEGRIYGFFYIPEGFAAEATAQRQPTISFYLSSSFMIGGSLLFQDMETMSVLASKAVGLKTGLAYGMTERAIMAKIQPICVHSHALGNPWLNYSVYLNSVFLPGILQLLIFLITVFSIGTEIKEGTSREWLRLSGDSYTVAMMGKILPQTVLWSICGLLFYSLMYNYCHFPLNCSPWVMLSAMLLLIIASQSMGIFFISMLPTLRMGLSFASLLGCLSFSICGFSFPVEAMPEPLHALAYIFPMRHYFLICIREALNGFPLHYAWHSFVILMCYPLLPILTSINLKYALKNFKYVP